MDLVRALYRAVNRSDAAAVAACYDEACVLEHVYLDDEAVYEGRAAAEARWAEEFARYAGALPGDRRVDVARVAGIETGWGWVRADWVTSLADRRGGPPATVAGYSHFWIEDGRIRRHRSVRQSAWPAPAAGAVPSPAGLRERPRVGVGAVILTGDGAVVLVKRRKEPLASQWSLPGGLLELGETLEAGAAREIREETGLVVEVGPLVEVFDRILLDEAGSVQYHFVLADYLCRPVGGRLAAGSDVAEVALADPAALGPYRVTEKARDVIARAVTMNRGHAW